MIKYKASVRNESLPRRLIVTAAAAAESAKRRMARRLILIDAKKLGIGDCLSPDIGVPQLRIYLYLTCAVWFLL